MSLSTFSVRMDESLKKEFDSLCRQFGMNPSTAINIFASAVVRERKIPFEISAKDTDVTARDARQAFMRLREQAAGNGAENMSLEEINSEICNTRQSK